MQNVHGETAPGQQVDEASPQGDELQEKRRAAIYKAIKELEPRALKVWFVLGSWMSKPMKGKPEKCWPSIPQIAERAGCSQRQVNRCLKTLREKGWITSKANKKPGTQAHASNEYYPTEFGSTRRWYALTLLGDYQGA